MEDFDVFTNEIKYTKTGFNNILNKFANNMPLTPLSANYQSCKKLLAEEFMVADNDLMGVFNLSEAVSASLRTLAVYRDEQLKYSNGDAIQKMKTFFKPLRDLVNVEPMSKEDEKICPFLKEDFGIDRKILEKYNTCEDEPLYKKYLRFSHENNVNNFKEILKQLPEEWTIVQLTAPYNPNENLKCFEEYRKEIPSIYISLLANDYMEKDSVDPFTVQVPANVIREGEKPLFTELYSLLDENYKTIESGQYYYNKRLLKNYWDKREDIDLRMKSVINVMDRDWLGGWKTLLTGKLVDSSIKEKVKVLVDGTISDWGFIQLTPKQKLLLYNMIECSHWLTSGEIKSTVRRILTEYGNVKQMRDALMGRQCAKCNFEFKYINELCIKCLAYGFEGIHKFKLVDGIKAFSDAAMQVREYESWSDLKSAKRQPVVLIVDEMLDSFPWESLPILNIHPVSRMENIHFLYYLYKVHEKDIVDGYFIAKPTNGRYIINPEKNLERMEKRMSSFVQYWCPEWIGEISKPPEPNVFIDYLKEADLFLYCGHGSGCQFASGSGAGTGVEGARGGHAAALLSGCGSVRLTHAGGRAPPVAAHHQYHIANSPMTVGMLWEVTDMEVDKVVSKLLALYIPSKAPVSWDSVGKSQWSNGVLDVNVEQKGEFQTENDLLVAVAMARRSTKFILIASSMVARGIPIKIASDDLK